MNILKTTISIILILVLTSRIAAQTNSQPEPGTIYMTAVAWSHDGGKIAAVGIQPPPEATGYLYIMDVQSGRILYQLQPKPGGFTTVAWSPDDRFIAAGGYDQVIWIIDVIAQNPVAALRGHQSTITDLSWNSTGTQLVSSGNWDGLTILWDMSTYKQIRVVEAGDSFPMTVAFSPDDRHIAVGGETGIQIYDSADTKSQNPAWYFKDSNIAALAWNHNGSRIAFGTQTFPNFIDPANRAFAQLYVIDSSTGTELAHLQTDDEAIFGLEWSPDDNLISTYSLNGVVRIWDAKSGTALESFSGIMYYPADVDFSPFGGRLAYGGVVSANLLTASQVGASNQVQHMMSGLVQIIVPAPSLGRLRLLTERCGVQSAIEQQMLTHLESNQLQGFIQQAEALNSDQIPPGCAADLIAVANALMAVPQ